MEDWQHRTVIQAMAVMVEVEGMKSRNKLQEYRNEPPVYAEEHFDCKSQELERLARDLT